MLAFQMTLEAAMWFYTKAEELNLKTEEERTELLVWMAELGMITRVTKTDRTMDQYVEDLGKNFDVLDMRQPKCGEETLDAVWCKDSDTGEDVLIDRKTNQIIMRGKP